ncbi:MAG: ABC transporter substrate-binding protein [Alphaproteobacteria bacterium]|nr:ABC transporter substrate-binding protein [Alphaproteobacteria bacterium]
MPRLPARLALAALVAIATIPAHAAEPIRVGVTVSQTGPAASLGIPQRNTVALLPTEISGREVKYILLDDASDTTKAVANTRKLIDEDKADVIIGSSVTPASLAMVDVVAEKQVPMISLGASSKIIDPPGGARVWVFKTPQNDSLMADAVADHMAKHGIKTVAFIGFNDAYGDGWLTEATRALEAKGIKLVDTERYARADTSVTGQTLKMMAAKPDAVLIAGSGTPAALPEKTLKERGYTGKIYQTHGVANADFLRVGGKDVEGTILPAGPVLVAAQLPDSNPIKPVALKYVHDYDAKYGAGSMATFGAHLYDADLLLQQAIPLALKKGEPGTPAFRSALRDALEGLHEVVLTQGVANMSPKDHNGFDQRARVMVTIQDGKWVLLH